MATTRRKTAKKRATTKTAVSKLNPKMGKWIWIGAAAIGLVVLMSSFKSSSSSSVTAATCLADPTCKKNYWIWKINQNQAWIAEIQRKATAAGITFAAQAEMDALWIIQQNWAITPEDMAAYIKTL